MGTDPGASRVSEQRGQLSSDPAIRLTAGTHCGEESSEEVGRGHAPSLTRYNLR